MSRYRQTKINAPATPPASTEELYYDTAGPGIGGPPALASKDENGVIAMIAHYGILDYRLIKVTHVFQGTTTYTPANGTRALFVECFGAGGGGGGCATAATNAAAAGGGGSGAYSAVWLTGAQVKASFSCVVGAGGAGGVAGANNGSVGTDTTFDSASVCTGKGGLGGIAVTVTVGPVVGGVGGAGGAAASGVGDVKMDGAAGSEGYMLAAAQASSGDGGGGWMGQGKGQGRKTQGAGSNAGNYGAGGGGGCILSGGASVAGGNGSNGLIRVWEFA
jgi:hypothetical protein